MISNFPAILNINRLFLKLNRFICNYLRGAGHFQHHPSASPAVRVKNNGGPSSNSQHNPNNFMARTERKVWCDRGMTVLPDHSLETLGS